MYEYTTPLLESEGNESIMDSIKFRNILEYGRHNELCMACD